MPVSVIRPWTITFRKIDRVPTELHRIVLRAILSTLYILCILAFVHFLSSPMIRVTSSRRIAIVLYSVSDPRIFSSILVTCILV